MEAGQFVHCSGVQFVFETTHLNNAAPSMLGRSVLTRFCHNIPFNTIHLIILGAAYLLLRKIGTA